MNKLSDKFNLPSQKFLFGIVTTRNTIEQLLEYWREARTFEGTGQRGDKIAPLGGADQAFSLFFDEPPFLERFDNTCPRCRGTDTRRLLESSFDFWIFFLLVDAQHCGQERGLIVAGWWSGFFALHPSVKTIHLAPDQ